MQSVMRRCVRRGRAVNMSIKPTRRYAPRIWHTGISVKVQSERSQHANKRLARLLIAWKLEQQQQENSAVLKSQRRMFHHQIERGNPRRTFTGMAFIEG